MRLGLRITVWTAGTLIAIGAAVFLVGVKVVSEGFAHIERQKLELGIGRARDALAYAAEDLSVKLADWASWDDAYQFVQDRNAAFVESNMNRGSLESLRIDSMVFIDGAGKAVAAASAHSDSRDLTEISPALAELVARRDPVLDLPEGTEDKAGLLRLGDQIAVVAARPILNSHSEGPSRGILVFVRLASPEFVEGLSQRLRSNFSLTLVAPETRMADSQTRIEGDDRIVTTTLLPDVQGRPLCRMDCVFDRPVHREAQRSMTYFLAALSVAGLTAVVTSIWTMRRIVVSRLAVLHRQIVRIQKSGDLSMRVDASGNDELTHVAASINELMSSVQAARAELAASEGRFRAMADGSPMLVWVIGPDKQATYFNRAWLEFTGRGMEAQLGTGWEGVVHEEDRGPSTSRFYVAFDARRPYQDEYRIQRHDGAYRWVLDKGVPLYDAHGHFAGFIGSCVDITERREMEERLRAAEATAQQASHAKSEFVSHLSHEIRTPMTAILGYADLLGDEGLDGLSRERRDEAVQAIRRNGQHLLALVNDVLDLSKIEAGRMTVERLACSPRELASELTSLLHTRAQTAGIELRVEVDETVPHAVLTDPLRLRQVLLNIAGNAVKFTRQGGVTVRMRYRDGDQPELQTEVTDSGIGMTAEQLDKLFGEYAQVDDSIARRFGGTGLGLCISRRLAGLLGGDITATSRPGQGSTFTITVAAPKAEATPPTSTASGSPGTAGTLRGRILLAEDSIDSQRLIRFVLERAGAQVETAGNGREVLDLVRAARENGEPFDLVLMDTQMPEMDGLEATRRLRAMGMTTPILALTANALAEDKRRCLEAGCDEHAAKPIDRVALIATCHRLMAAERTKAATAA